MQSYKKSGFNKQNQGGMIMKKISIDELIDMVDSRYSLVTIISKRARQIIDGQDILVKTATLKPVCVAIEEFYDKAFEAVYDLDKVKQADAISQIASTKQTDADENFAN